MEMLLNPRKWVNWYEYTNSAPLYVDDALASAGVCLLAHFKSIPPETTTAPEIFYIGMTISTLKSHLLDFEDSVREGKNVHFAGPIYRDMFGKHIGRNLYFYLISTDKANALGMWCRLLREFQMANKRLPDCNIVMPSLQLLMDGNGSA
ncbi:MAG: hypothetical protein MJE68_33205 [Proteobacteria bacterium]|nr:hypothetical protein [Pseudomonadota bacterium]